MEKLVDSTARKPVRSLLTPTGSSPVLPTNLSNMKIKYLIAILLISIKCYSIDTLLVSDINDKRLILYNDSMKLFTSSVELKSKL